MGLLGAPSTTQVARGDELTDAKAKQAQLKKDVAAQKAAAQAAAPTKDKEALVINEVERGFYMSNAFTDDDVEVLSALADQVGLAAAGQPKGQQIVTSLDEASLAQGRQLLLDLVGLQLQARA